MGLSFRIIKAEEVNIPFLDVISTLMISFSPETILWEMADWLEKQSVWPHKKYLGKTVKPIYIKKIRKLSEELRSIK